MSRRLNLSPSLRLPEDVAGEAVGILATRGAGKSYASAVLVEELYASKIQFAVLDPTGVYWGLRAGADGDPKGGLPIIVLGGPHGDAPLEPTAGALIADVLVDTGQSLIIDLSDFGTKGEQTRFVTAFAERLFPRKARERSTLHLVVDEADEFAPQKAMRDEARMLGAMERLVRRGRSRGVGVTLITQRSAALNKNVLDVVDTLVAMRMLGPRNRKVIEGWITVKSLTDEEGLLDSLAGLPTGTAWIWSPVRDVLKRVPVRRIKTFDSYATPKPGQAKKEPRELRPIDVSKLGKEIEATKERAKATDPTALTKRIRELEAQLASRQVERGPVEVERVVEIAHVPPQLVAAIEKTGPAIADIFRGVMKSLDGASGNADVLFTRLRETAQEAVRQARVPAPQKAAARIPARRRESPVPPPIVRQPPGERDSDPSGDLKAGARRMLEVLARNYPMRVTKAQLATMVTMSRKGGTFNSYLSAFRVRGLIDESDGLIQLSEAGMAEVDHVPRVPLSAEEMREQWRSLLKAGAREMLDVLLSAHPGGLTKDDLAERVGMTRSGGTFNSYLSKLRVNGLIEDRDGQVFASETFFATSR